MAWRRIGLLTHPTPCQGHPSRVKLVWQLGRSGAWSTDITTIDWKKLRRYLSTKKSYVLFAWFVSTLEVMCDRIYTKHSIFNLWSLLAIHISGMRTWIYSSIMLWIMYLFPTQGGTLHNAVEMDSLSVSHNGNWLSIGWVLGTRISGGRRVNL